VGALEGVVVVVIVVEMVSVTVVEIVSVEGGIVIDLKFVTVMVEEVVIWFC
jgi:hypothetical protein